MRVPRQPIAVSTLALFQGILMSAMFVFMAAGGLILSGEVYPGLDLLGVLLVVAYIGVLLAITEGMGVDRERKLILIRIPAYSNPLGPNQGFDSRSVDAARRRAVDPGGNPKIG